jgi:hypothetical protein
LRDIEFIASLAAFDMVLAEFVTQYFE